MKKRYKSFWLQNLPVLPPRLVDTLPPRLVDTLNRYIWNIGLWSTQSYGLHWLAKFAIICFFSTNCTQLAAVIIERDDTDRVFECVSIFSFCCIGTLKLSNLILNKARWQYLLTQVTTIENEQKHGISDVHCVEYDTDDDNESQLPYIERYTRNYLSISKIVVKLYITTVVIFITTPFIEYAVQGESGVYPHILPVWAPLDQLGFFGYFIGIVFEAVAAIYCLLVHLSFDCTSVGMMFFVRGQFSLLRRQTENIGGQGRDTTLCGSRDDRAQSRIKKAHVTHLTLCRVMGELDATLRTILGVYYLVSTLTVCFVAIRLNSQTLSAMKLVSLLQYMCGILTQLFLFCRYGDAVLHESSFGMGEGPLGAAWWGLGPAIRRELVLLGIGMSKPRRLRAGPFNTLDLPSFVQIVRAAYSFYAVLGQTSK